MKILIGDKVITGDGKTAIKNGAVAYENGLIAAVGEAEQVRSRFPQAQAERKEGVIMPGLVEMHAHVGSWWHRPDMHDFEISPYLIPLFGLSRLKEALAQGVTTIRSVGDPKGMGGAIRGAYAKGFFKGPRFISSERVIGVTGGHFWQNQDFMVEADGPWGMKQAVRQCVKEGAEWIKVMNSSRADMSQMTLEELRAITEEAARWGKKCSIHASTPQAIEYAIEAGFDTIEHGCYMTPAMAEKAAVKGIAWIPTAYIHISAVPYLTGQQRRRGVPASPAEIVQNQYFEKVERQYRQNFMANYNTGMLVGAGTDVDFIEFPCNPMAEELELFCQMGLTSLQAIQCGTQTGARILGLENVTGEIREGLAADMIVVGGDPEQDIMDIKKIDETYVGGQRLFERGERPYYPVWKPEE